MITLTPITRVQAAALSGIRLPYGYRWYLATGAEWFPNYGDWRHTWAGETGLNAVIGKQKAAVIKEQAA